MQCYIDEIFNLVFQRHVHPKLAESSYENVSFIDIQLSKEFPF